MIINAEYFYHKACLIIGPSEALSRANCKRHCQESRGNWTSMRSSSIPCPRTSSVCSCEVTERGWSRAVVLATATNPRDEMQDETALDQVAMGGVVFGILYCSNFRHKMGYDSNIK